MIKDGVDPQGLLRVVEAYILELTSQEKLSVQEISALQLQVAKAQIEMSLKPLKAISEQPTVLKNISASFSSVSETSSAYDKAIALARRQAESLGDDVQVTKLEQEKSEKILELLTERVDLVKKVVIDSIVRIESQLIRINQSLDIKKDIDLVLIQLTSLLEQFQPAANLSETHLVDKIKSLKMEVLTRFKLHLAFLKASATYEASGSSELRGKTIEQRGLNDDNFPLYGNDVSFLIHRGVTSTEEGLNTENTMSMANIMRALDKIYAGKIVVRYLGQEVPISKLFFRLDAVVVAIKESSDQQPPLNLDEETLRVAMRLHGLITQHESILPDKTPTLPDEYQKLYRPDLKRKYMEGESLVAGSLMIGEQNTNWMKSIFTDKDIAWIENKMEGFDAVMAYLRYLLQIRESDQLNINQTVRLLNEHEFIRQEVVSPLLSFDCVKTPLDAMSHASGLKKEGKSFDEYKNEQGEFLYEDMPFEKTSSALLEYYSQLPNVKAIMDVLDCIDLKQIDQATASADAINNFKIRLRHSMRLLKLPPNMEIENLFGKIFFRFMVIQFLRNKPFGGFVIEEFRKLLVHN